MNLTKKFNVLVILLLILSMIASSVFSNTLSVSANTASDIQISVIPNPDIDIVLSLGNTSVNAANFETDIKTRLRNLGIDTSKVKIQSVQATEQSTFEGKFTMNIMWTGANGQSDVDTYLEYLTPNSSLGSLYYGNRTGFYGSSIDIDDTNGGIGEWTTVDFNGVPSEVNILDFKADLYSGVANNVTFSLIRNINGVSQTMVTDTKYVSGKAPNYTSFGKLVRNGDVWDFHYINGAVYPGKVVVITAKKFTEVLRQPEWRTNSKKILVNMEETLVSDFGDASALGEIVPRLSNEDIHFISYGNSINKTQQENVIRMNNNNGAFYDIGNYSAALNNTATYIKNLIDSQRTSSQYALVGEPVDITVNPSSFKTNTQNANYPQGRWKIDHDYSYFNNNLGQASWANQYQKDLLMVFDKPGRYEIFFENNNPSPRYIYAHRRPIANYSLNIIRSSSQVTVSVNDLSYDPDREFSSDKGIKDREWKWRESNSSNWNYGVIPSSLPLNKDYIIQLRVKDEYGVWSFSEQRYITTGNSYVKPIANFNLNSNIISKYENLTYNESSYDPSGNSITERLWTVRKNGTVIHSQGYPLTNFLNHGEGEYVISLKVKNNQNLWSEEFNRPLSVTNDLIPPEATITPTMKDWTNQSYNINVNFTDVGMSGLYRQRYALTNSNTFPSSGFSEYSTSSSRSINVSTNGTYYLHLEAYDNAGNRMIRTSGPYKFDNTAPNKPVINLNNLNWTASAPTFNISNISDGHSGIDKVEYRYNSGTWQTYTVGTTVTIPSNLQGNINVETRAIDNAGNISLVGSSLAKFDSTKPLTPTINLNTSNWTSSPVTFGIGNISDVHSGVKTVEYRYNSGAWQTYTVGSTVTIPSNLQGNINLEARVTDNVNNISTSGSAVAKFDTTAPVKPVINLSETNWTIPGVTFNISSISDAHSGVKKAEYRYNNGSWINYTVGSTVTIPSDLQGIINIEARVIDNVENISPSGNGVAKIDNIKPVIDNVEVVKVNDETQGFKVTAHDDESGLHTSGAYNYYLKINDVDSVFREVSKNVSNNIYNIPNVPSSTLSFVKSSVRDLNNNISIESQIKPAVSAPVVSEIKTGGDGEYDNTVTINLNNTIGKDVKVEIYRGNTLINVLSSGNQYKDKNLYYERSYQYKLIAFATVDGVRVESLPELVSVEIGSPTLEAKPDSSIYYITPFTDEASITGEVAFAQGGNALIEVFDKSTNVSKNKSGVTRISLSPQVKTTWRNVILLDESEVENKRSLNYRLELDLEDFKDLGLYKKTWDLTVDFKDVKINNLDSNLSNSLYK